jgi:hypothetical protein
MFNPSIVPAFAYRYPFKYIEVLLDADTGTWLVLVFHRASYETVPDGGSITPIDCFAARDEVTAISRAKKEHPYLVIAKTAGELKTLQL